MHLSDFAVRPLDVQPDKNVMTFSCARDGKANVVDDFFYNAAWDAHEKRLVKTWLVYHKRDVAGFFSLSATQEALSFIPGDQRRPFSGIGYNYEFAGVDAARSTRRRILPGVYINYFGVDVRYKGLRLADAGFADVKVSDLLFRSALDVALQTAALVGVTVVSLDAIRASGVIDFYKAHGFRQAVGPVGEKAETLPMYLLAATLEAARDAASRP